MLLFKACMAVRAEAVAVAVAVKRTGGSRTKEEEERVEDCWSVSLKLLLLPL